MSKLAPALKDLINAGFARPGPSKASASISAVFEKIATEAAQNKVGIRPWVTLSAATAFTLNCPDGVSALYTVASSPSGSVPKPESPVAAAELIREVGLKCISFNGIPRSINGLGAFRASLPPSVLSQLETKASRVIDSGNIVEANKRGQELWRSVYTPFDEKLAQKLADSHPDLPVHIFGSHYAPLLSDPPQAGRGGLAKVGRVLTSILAVACLRAQTGVGPQVLSHVFGLRKAIEQGFHKDGAEKVNDEDERKGLEWLATEEGSEWLLKSVDEIVDTVGHSFATRESKL